MFAARVLADSSSFYNNSRLTTMELVYPRIIHSEIMTHRMFSRNAASSRAVPIKVSLQHVMDNPFIPKVWGMDESGMQANKFLADTLVGDAESRWLRGRDRAVETAQELIALGLHKQVINRVLEPWLWITVIVSATNWSNFFALRCHKDAEPHMKLIADLTCAAFNASGPTLLDESGWHLPYVDAKGRDAGLELESLIKVSVARCARVSFLRSNEEFDLVSDLRVYNRLSTNGHWSPFEHIARPYPGGGPCLGGNFGAGWMQLRKTFSNECR